MHLTARDGQLGKHGVSQGLPEEGKCEATGIWGHRRNLECDDDASDGCGASVVEASVRRHLPLGAVAP